MSFRYVTNPKQYELIQPIYNFSVKTAGKTGYALNWHCFNQCKDGTFDFILGRKSQNTISTYTWNYFETDVYNNSTNHARKMENRCK